MGLNYLLFSGYELPALLNTFGLHHSVFFSSEQGNGTMTYFSGNIKDGGVLGSGVFFRSLHRKEFLIGKQCFTELLSYNFNFFIFFFLPYEG